MKKVSRYEEKKNREKRAFAALHCAHYQECLDKAAKSNKRLECHKCEMLKIVPDSYQKEVNVAAFNNQNADEQSIKVEHFQCKTGAMNINRQSSKQGKKIMEKDEGQKSEVGGQKSDVETQVCKEKDCEHGGKPQPINDFMLHPKNGARFKMCNSCLTKRKAAGQQRRQEKALEKLGQARKPVTKTQKRTPDEPAETPEKTITLCFKSYPKIYKDLIDLAEAEVRTLENQVIFILKKRCENGRKTDGESP